MPRQAAEINLRRMSPNGQAAAELEVAADEVLSVTRQGLDYYAELFGVPYPFGEYHQAFVAHVQD